MPCLVADDGELIAGHGRVLAATQLGLLEAPVIVLGHLTWPARAAALMADELSASCCDATGQQITVEPAAMQKVLEKHVRAHLDELAEVRPDFR